MKDNFSFILSEYNSIFVLWFLCFLLFFYIASPESKTLDLKSTATTIELDMITEIAEKRWSKKDGKNNRKKRLKKKKLPLHQMKKDQILNHYLQM